TALVAVLAASAPDAGTHGPQVIDRIVAIVERRPLLLSELEFEARIALIQQGGTGAATAPLTDEDLAAALEWAIGQRLALAEAERLQVFDVEESEVTKALKAFQARFASDKQLLAFLDSQEATQEQLAAVLLRELRVSRFLDSKVKLSARASEEELRRYYAGHVQELGGRPYEQVRDSIKAQLTRERYVVLAGKQLDELRARADVRTVAPFARPSEPPNGDAAPEHP
ncbi:MAG: hypothetical protein HY901_24960, partial [Deltaproteobacteria bacterium]|nr:hypothetical protein [Deltaproteobacteria bacterium]